ncbi:hypothetical protein BKA56DRAFT_5088 [Ilyonectria sp. MPI-CAGE-AT-0026]|nr:hypothetical protein BKA56DRAFT_5088 [Ilyonectria sp. MPI-CAGE-AT-0026]
MLIIVPCASTWVGIWQAGSEAVHRGSCSETPFAFLLLGLSHLRHQLVSTVQSYKITSDLRVHGPRCSILGFPLRLYPT